MKRDHNVPVNNLLRDAARCRVELQKAVENSMRLKWEQSFIDWHLGTANILKTARTFVWNLESYALAVKGLETFPTDIPFTRDWLLTPDGFWWLPDETFIAFVYGVVFSKEENYKPVTKSDAEKLLNDEKPITVQVTTFRLWGDDSPHRIMTPFTITEGHTINETIESLSETLKKQSASKAERENTCRSHRIICQFFGSTSHWLKQKLATIERKAMPFSLPTKVLAAQPKEPVLIVSLRKREAREYEGEGAGKEYSCRWIVHGHWHKYHTKKGLEVKWLDDYIKGDESKPLVIKEQKFAVVR